MPKLKTHSGSKKRFKVTANGHVKVQAAAKRHGMVKRSQKMKRNARGTMVLQDQDARIILKNFLRNA
jgi:large subunit ribosomal protein L35